MRIGYLFTSFAIVGLAGCSTIGAKLAQAPVSIGDIMHAVRCEIKAGIAPGGDNPLRLAEWVAIATISLKLEDSGNVAPGLDMTIKSNDTELKLNNTGSGSSSSIKRNAVFRYNVKPLSATNSENCPEPGSAYAAKGLDLSAWLRRVNSGMGGAKLEDLDTKVPGSTKLDYNVSFSVTAAAGGALSFKTSFLTAKIGSAENNKHVNENSIALTFSPPVLGDGASDNDDPLQAVIDALRQAEIDQEAEDDKTTIEVGPGQVITIQ